jgi:hypothetical protein
MRRQELGFKFMIDRNPRAMLGAATLMLSAMSSTGAFAGVADYYRFEVASAQATGPLQTDVAIKLLHTPDGKPITDAVIFESRTDMGPSGMEDMAGKVTPTAPDKDGLYHFRTKTGMAGKWALHLSAKVQGETETVQGTVEFDAK